MSRDLYPVLSAASTTWRHLQHISNNLSNINTTGFKESRVSFEDALNEATGTGKTPGGNENGYVKIGRMVPDMSDGNLIQDNVNTHFALRGDGFFAVQTGNGETLMQRSGAFQLDTQGYLVNQMGEKVLTTTGPIQFDDYQKENFTLSADGRFLDERGAEFSQLLVLTADELKPVGGTRWRGENMREISEPLDVVQGALEGSNVNPFRSMIEMLETTRHFELYQKTMQSSRDMDNSINMLGKRIQ